MFDSFPRSPQKSQEAIQDSGIVLLMRIVWHGANVTQISTSYMFLFFVFVFCFCGNTRQHHIFGKVLRTCISTLINSCQGVYLQAHALHRTRWIVRCGRLRILCSLEWVSMGCDICCQLAISRLGEEERAGEGKRLSE